MEWGAGNDEVVWLEMDLKDPRSSKKAAEKFIKREKKLDILSLHIFICLHDAGTLSELQFPMQGCESHAMSADGRFAVPQCRYLHLPQAFKR